RLPSAVGSDGVHHMDRFLCVTDSRYRPGDEFLLGWLGRIGNGDPLFVGVPRNHKRTPGGIELTGTDFVPLLKKTRATELEGLACAPLDAIVRYSRVWGWKAAEDFAGWTTIAGNVTGGTYAVSGRGTKLLVNQVATDTGRGVLVYSDGSIDRAGYLLLAQ